MRERFRGAGQKNAPDETIRWGDTIRLVFNATNTVQAAEFQRVDLPRPLVCKVALHVDAVVQGASPTLGVVNFTAFQFTVGVGSSMSVDRLVFEGQPQIPIGGAGGGPVVAGFAQPNGTPLDVDFELPLQSFNGRVEASGNMVLMNFTLQIAPVDSGGLL